ncbi:MAG TPA: hypothetical protein VMB78_08165 [Dissulfurispiraceae bacterium]|nr:hypothetical protein [Dissulfurispiraceae bacterium]
MDLQNINTDSWQQWRGQVRVEMKGCLPAKLRPETRNVAWTPLQVFHHVLLADVSIVKLLNRLLEKNKDIPQRTSPNFIWPIRREFIEYPFDKAFSVEATKGTEPNQSVAENEITELESISEAGFSLLAELSSKLLLDEISFPHRLLGTLNFYEWLVFSTLHEELHTKRLILDL